MLLKELVWKAIEEQAAGLVEKSAELITKEQAVDRFLQTPAGKEMYAWYIGPYADLPVEKALDKMARDAEYVKLGLGSRQEAVCRMAEFWGGGDVLKGLEIVRKEMPEVYAEAFPE